MVSVVMFYVATNDGTSHVMTVGITVLCFLFWRPRIEVFFIRGEVQRRFYVHVFLLS